MSASTAAITFTRQTFHQLELKLPAKVEKRFADLERIRNQAATTITDRPPNEHSLGAAIADALRNNRDPIMDPAVRDIIAVAEFARSGGVTALNTYLEDAYARTFDDHIDDLINVMSPTVDAADETLRNAREILPDLDLESTHRLGQFTPTQLAAWGHGREAIARLERVAKCWGMLAHASGHALPKHRRPLVLADLDAGQLATLGHQPQAVAAATAGHSLSLATRAEFDRRCARVASETQEQVGAEDRAVRNTWANQLRIARVRTA